MGQQKDEQNEQKSPRMFRAARTMFSNAMDEIVAYTGNPQQQAPVKEPDRKKPRHGGGRG